MSASVDELRQTVDRLQDELSDLEHEEAELERQVRAFGVRYRDELGPLVERLLEIRKKRLKQSSRRHRRSARLRNAYQDARSAADEFRETMEAADPDESPQTLTDEEQEQLKSTFREASKQCHPDMVESSKQEEAATMFNELREAYQKNDLDRVESIAEELDVQGVTADDSALETPETLQEEIDQLRDRIEEVKTSIDELRSSEAYTVLTEVRDLDAYFERRKRQLRDEIRRWRRGRLA